MQKVIPPGLNYGDIKPEAIENQIRIVKFTPIATIQQAKANDVVRFHLQGNGFYDPYSAYIRIRVQLDDIATPADDAFGLSGRFLDRSAHSLFSRLVIRSQGTELERIEQYDVIAAMINDMVYSQEQRVLHHYEGFSHKQTSLATIPAVGSDLTTAGGTDGIKLLPFLSSSGAQTLQNRMGDYGAWKMRVRKEPTTEELLQRVGVAGANATPIYTFKTDLMNGTSDNFADVTGIGEESKKAAGDADASVPVNASNSNLGITFKSVAAAKKFAQFGSNAKATYEDYPLGVTDFGQPYRMSDQFFNPTSQFDHGVLMGVKQTGFYQSGAGGDYAGVAADAHQGFKLFGADTILQNGNTMEFCIPIYSGILGVLMPQKKLIPMSLLPLEVEFTMNPHAFYPVGAETSRKYSVTKFEIWSHTMFFEQELHRSLEAAVAESGVFIHYNSFYLAPVNTYNATPGKLPNYNQIGVFLKSINSLHWTFLYNSFEQDNGPRKLHFVSHNTNSLQVRNGMDLMPSEPLVGQTGGTTVGTAIVQNQHSPFIIELYKGWNKMHDPLSDAALDPYRYNLDNLLTKPTTTKQFLNQFIDMGCCQYAISFEGDELGMNKSIISGKKSVMPFDINIDGYKSQAVTSYMMCFLRADFIIYVRPDLVVTRLGL